MPWRHEGLCPEAANDLEPRLRAQGTIVRGDKAQSFVAQGTIVRGDKAQTAIVRGDKAQFGKLCLIATNDCALSHERLCLEPRRSLKFRLSYEREVYRVLGFRI